MLSEVAPTVGNGFPNSITDEFVAAVEGTATEAPAGSNGGTETVGVALAPGADCRGGTETVGAVPIPGEVCRGGTETVGEVDGKLVGAIATA